MSNDAISQDFTHLLSMVQEQMRDLNAMQKRRAALTATATAADGTVEITVDAQRMVTRTVIDEAYVEEFELADLGGHITAAAQDAAREIERQAAALLAPLTARRQELSSLSGLVKDVPDFGNLLSSLTSTTPPPPHSGDGDEGLYNQPSYPTVRR